MGDSSDSKAASKEDAKPNITEKFISASSFTGDKLSKSVGNWKAWSNRVGDSLDMRGLGSHIDGTGKPPDKTLYPLALATWTHNDKVVRGYIRHNIDDHERELVEGDLSALQCWDTLKKHHEDEGPIKQVNLIQGALNTRIPRDETMVDTARRIREDIRRAFKMPGGISEETFICIALLNALATGHDHSRAIIQRDMQNATKEKPYLSDTLIQLLTQDHQLILGDKQRLDTTNQSIALAAQVKTNGKKALFCSNCKKTTHTAEYCISPGGGMAGKSL
ncbi:hypothetical protein BDN72DRAFT_767054, partial [Pluteus cervinus]